MIINGKILNFNKVETKIFKHNYHSVIFFSPKIQIGKPNRGKKQHVIHSIATVFKIQAKKSKAHSTAINGYGIQITYTFTSDLH